MQDLCLNDNFIFFVLNLFNWLQNKFSTNTPIFARNLRLKTTNKVSSKIQKRSGRSITNQMVVFKTEFNKKTINVIHENVEKYVALSAH